MPSKKTWVVLIVCLGIIVSVYLLARNSKTIQVITQSVTGISTNPYVNITGNANDNWKNILTGVIPNQSTTTLANGGSMPEDTTLTAQLSRDMFSRYLLIANKPGGVTEDDATQIADEVLSSPEYTQAIRVTYSETNLHITSKSDKATMKTYADTLNKSLQEASARLKNLDNPLMIFSSAVQTENEAKLKELAPYILTNKNLVNELMQMEVPKSIASMHVDLLNAFSNCLSDLESLNQMFSDPAKGLIAVTNYQNDMDSFEAALEKINSYYKSKFGNGF